MSATINDVAMAANVSVATVSRALRGLPNVAPVTRARVLAVADELHYVADPHASRLAAGRTHTIGIVVPRLGQWYYATLLEAVGRLVGAAARDLLPFTLDDRPARELFLAKAPFRKRVDGLVVVDVPMTESQLAHMADTNVPIVTVGIRTEAFPSVTVNNAGGARIATEHLIRHGHTHIALLGAEGQGPFEFPIPVERRHGFEQAMGAAGLRVDPALVVSEEPSAAGGSRCAARLLQAPSRPTGIVALTDEMAMGAIRVLADVGLRVPGDVSVVGFDDHELAAAFGLTTVRQDVAGQGTRAADWVLQALVAPIEPGHVELPTQLVVRTTTGPARPPR